MASLYSEVTRILREYGCWKVRESKHEIWRSPITGRPFAVPRSLKSKHTANDIFRQAGIDRKM